MRPEAGGGGDAGMATGCLAVARMKGLMVVALVQF